MKALTFLEFYSKTIQQKVDYYDYWYAGQKIKNEWDTGVKRPHNDKLRIDLDNWYHKLTSQPFKPELITELFEGWEHLEDDDVYVNGKWIFDNDCSLFKNNDGANYGNANMNWIAFKPDTLERFISNCQQAGIELTWRTK